MRGEDGCHFARFSQFPVQLQADVASIRQEKIDIISVVLFIPSAVLSGNHLSVKAYFSVFKALLIILEVKSSGC